MSLFKEIIYPLFDKKKGDIQMDIRESFSENLKKQMKNYNSQEEFANYIGISHSMLQMYLHKKGNPRLDTLEEIAKKLGISVLELLGAPKRQEASIREIEKLIDKLTDKYERLLEYHMNRGERE